MCTTYMHYPQKPEEGTRSNGTGVTEVCKPACAYWELSLGPVQEQQPAPLRHIFSSDFSFVNF